MKAPIRLNARDLRRLPRCDSNIVACFRGPGVGRRVQEALSGRIHPDMDRALRSMAAQRMLQMDEVTARLLRHAGVNPVVAAALAMLTTSILNEIHLERDDATFATVGLSTYVSLGDAGWWEPARDRLAHLDAIVPDTLHESYVGEPLSRLLSHPALDDLPLVITGLEGDSHGHVELSGVRRLDEELATYLPAV